MWNNMLYYHQIFNLEFLLSLYNVHYASRRRISIQSVQYRNPLTRRLCIKKVLSQRPQPVRGYCPSMC